jgi:hypothetical protein
VQLVITVPLWAVIVRTDEDLAGSQNLISPLVEPEMI